MTVSLASQVLAVRRVVNQRLASRGVARPAEAAMHDEQMVAVLRTLEWLQRNEANIRAAAGAALELRP